MSNLIPDADIRAYLPTMKLSDGQLAAINLLVGGWLREAAGATALPSPDRPSDPLRPDHPLYAAAFELIVMVAVNPEGLISVTNGPTTRNFGDQERKDAILESVRTEVGTASTAGPAGVFPPAETWPDAFSAGPRWW